MLIEQKVAIFALVNFRIRTNFFTFSTENTRQNTVVDTSSGVSFAFIWSYFGPFFKDLTLVVRLDVVEGMAAVGGVGGVSGGGEGS